MKKKTKKAKKKVSRNSKKSAGDCVRYIIAKNERTGEDMLLVLRAELSSITAMEMLDIFSQGEPMEYSLTIEAFTSNAKLATDLKAESKRFMRSICSKDTAKKLLMNSINYETIQKHSPEWNSKKKSKNIKN
jgi:hypothetical protein